MGKIPFLVVIHLYVKIFLNFSEVLCVNCLMILARSKCSMVVALSVAEC